jgi:hypothetical protein
MWNVDLALNEIITGARVLELYYRDDLVLSHCAWNPKYVSEDRPLCPWTDAATKAKAFRNDPANANALDDNSITQLGLYDMLPYFAKAIQSKTNILKEEYAGIRKPGDLFDQIMTGEYHVYKFDNATWYTATDTLMVTFWNVLAASSDAANTLAENINLSEASERDWAYIMANRYNLISFITDLTDQIPGQSRLAINNNMIFHLSMSILSIVIGVCSYVFLILPKIYQIQADREAILKLLLLVPKSVAFDLVNNVYTTTTAEQDEDVEKKEDDKDSESSDEESDSEENDEASDTEGTEGQEIAVVSDKSRSIYYTFIFGLSLLCVPVIANAIFRFIGDQTDLATVDLINDLTTLYGKVTVLSWQSFAGYFKCEHYEFCYPDMEVGMEKFIGSVDTLEKAYKGAVSKMQAYPEIIEIFTLPTCFKSPNGIKRCVTGNSEFFPPNYYQKVGQGYSNLVQNYMSSCRRYSAEILSAYRQNEDINDIKNAYSSENDFWFMYEIPLVEGEAGGYMAYHTAVELLTEDLNSGNLVANVCYAVGLATSLIIFVVVFGRIRKRILTETRYSRGALFLVPHDVLRGSKPMIEYIENLYAAIG